MCWNIEMCGNIKVANTYLNKCSGVIGLVSSTVQPHVLYFSWFVIVVAFALTVFGFLFSVPELIL